MRSETFPVPVVDDVDTAGFWQATARHQLAIQTCEDCGQVLHLPKAFCHACGGWNTTWTTIRPLGHLYSWTTVQRQFHPAFAAPYTIILVELDDHPQARLIGYLPGTPELVAGTAMVATFEDVGGATVPVWARRDADDQTPDTHSGATP